MKKPRFGGVFSWAAAIDGPIGLAVSRRRGAPVGARNTLNG